MLITKPHSFGDRTLKAHRTLSLFHTPRKMGKLKSKHVLLCSEFTEQGLSFAKLLLEQDVKVLTVTNSSSTEDFNNTEISKNSKVKHVKADVTKIEDMEGVYKQTIKSSKKIDIVVNSKEITGSQQWEDDITKHINSMICCTLLALKHLGKMNSGKGGTVVNSLTLFGDYKSSENTMYMGISSLLDDLDRSFSDPYYYGSTGVQILTMCARMEIGNNGDGPRLGGITSGGGSEGSRWDARGSTLLKVIGDRKSCVQVMGKEMDAEGNGQGVATRMEQLEIAIEN